MALELYVDFGWWAVDLWGLILFAKLIGMSKARRTSEKPPKDRSVWVLLWFAKSVGFHLESWNPAIQQWCGLSWKGSHRSLSTHHRYQIEIKGMISFRSSLISLWDYWHVLEECSQRVLEEPRGLKGTNVTEKPTMELLAWLSDTPVGRRVFPSQLLSSPERRLVSFCIWRLQVLLIMFYWWRKQRKALFLQAILR